MREGTPIKVCFSLWVNGLIGAPEIGKPINPSTHSKVRVQGLCVLVVPQEHNEKKSVLYSHRPSCMVHQWVLVSVGFQEILLVAKLVVMPSHHGRCKKESVKVRINVQPNLAISPYDMSVKVRIKIQPNLAINPYDMTYKSLIIIFIVHFLLYIENQI